MLAGSIWDGVAFNGFTINHYLADTVLFAVRILDGDVVFCITELTLNGVFLRSGRQTGINLKTVILWFDA
jgi:hypothetical protein